MHVLDKHNTSYVSMWDNCMSPNGEYCGQGRGDINTTLQRTQIILVFVLDESATKVKKRKLRDNNSKNSPEYNCTC